MSIEVTVIEQVLVVEATGETSVGVDVDEQTITVAVEVAGPQGPPGISAEDAMPYAERIDMVGDTVIYRAYAELPAVDTDPAPLDSDPVWRIKRSTFTGNDLVVEWADGNALFDNVWDDHASLDYS